MQKVVCLVLLVVAFHSSAQRVKCVFESKYFIPNFTANWFKAVEYCNYLGMRLAVISSAEEQAKLTALVASTDKFSNVSTDIWIGGSDLAEEGNFYWHATGNRIVFTNWKKNQPDNGQKNEHCMEIRYIPEHSWDWHWNDRDCKAARYFVCENLEPGREITFF
ncbi:perlucin-like [Toxorhynchites rutilus septentrionalis]|uniref:perlucin-like n=1 Tax=Toxorhynchites rutilus septentrionalis TaxID=329112 RepID=UPI002479CA0A|nr:perlucin-like [Toxorhynchites rutilus septentrionalis]